ncbi:RHS repeat domain-containing protein [Psychrobacter pygoscelis]|uniref:RHS repeat domain-containing protein n=1 Tax=Psychrobacter pygoscelis TaxID=2488563 RepID=UPI001039714A|nr:RHS repeat-associated core domain-containing protein [Psychrobacter pygoscelis]
MNWSQTDQPVSYDYDLDGRLTKISDSALNRAYNYDAGNRITSILDGSANINYSYQHDKLDRLLKQNLQDTSLGYAYDANSNRTQSKITKDSAVDVNNISYETDSNRIVGVSYDASGRILDDGSRTYTYNPAGRIERIQNGVVGVFNIYNPIGQRIQKNSGNAKTYFSYDEQGLLIGEYDVNGAAIREYVYLGGQPIAMMTSERPDEVLQIHSDHLGTPRAVSNANNKILWRMEGDQFGDVQPSVEQVKLPLRHAGQYADDETGLFYNWHRYYDPSTGRYVTSDPIGLNGGMNTYGYVGGSPLSLVDPRGLNPAMGVGCAIGSFVGPLGCGAGAAIGGLVGAVATIAILSTPSDTAQDDTKATTDENTCESDECPPCTPYRKGTVGYIGPKFSVYGVHGTQTGTGEEHYILYRVGQNSKARGCGCYWQEDKKIAGHHYMWQPNIFLTVNLNHKVTGNTRTKFLPYP